MEGPNELYKMLHFFKKPGRGSSTHHDDSSILKQMNKRHSAHEVTCSDTEILDESLAEFDTGVKRNDQESRLSKNLRSILADKNCLSYFVQFLDAKNALSPLKFYLDSENFKTAADLISQSTSGNKFRQQRSKYDNCDCMKDYSSTILQGTQCMPCGISKNSSINEQNDSSSKNSYDISNKVSNCSQIECSAQPVSSKCNINLKMSKPKIKNISSEVSQVDGDCRFSMEKPLTDDEKSRICVENSIKYKYGELTKIKCDTGMEDNNSLIVADKSIVSDAIRIYKKYLINHSPCFIPIPSSILSNISLALCVQVEDRKTSISIPSNCFAEAQTYILDELEKKCLNEFLESVFYCRYSLNILSNGSLTLTDILYSDSALFYFTEYLEQEGKRNYLEFWMAATNFQKHYKSRMNGEFDKVIAQNDAMILYDKYFSLQASYRLKISDSVRSHIEESICADNQALVSCFDLAVRIIEGFFNKKYFKSFMESTLFENYLKELKVKINENKKESGTNSKILIRPTHRKTLSDCTSDIVSLARKSSISQHNTLLAMETVGSRVKIQATNVTGNDMQIDSKQLTDPDMLWHRDKGAANSVLTFGRVDPLGRYERDFEPSNSVEEKWSLSTGGSRLKNAVRKLVNLPEDRLQEEIAWQVAEMIIKDVTSITLRSPEASSSHGHFVAPN